VCKNVPILRSILTILPSVSVPYILKYLYEYGLQGDHPSGIYNGIVLKAYKANKVSATIFSK
jgi:hypothetical protein